MTGRLGHYRIVEKIGAGGMGEVYRAHDEQLDRDVALKVLPASRFSDDASRARLLREARSAAALNHPHICTIHEVGEADGQAYIAMEFIGGRPLSETIPKNGLPMEQVLRYGSQIASALAHAHENNIIHRDLKSSNVVITADGRAKVLDFGLAKRLSNEELVEATTRSQESLTQPGAVMGTLPYMAPEQLRGQGADARSDVWALGVVLHEMTSGARPFQGQTGYELSSAILSQPPGPLPPKVPVELRAVIERCLAKEPGARYQRAGEVRAALETLATGATVPGLKWKYLAKRRWFRAASALAVLVLVVSALLGLNVGGLRERLFGASVPRIESLAVLPLQNLSGDPEQEYLADGIHEALITDLAGLGGLKRVIARASVMRYKGTNKPLPEIARELNVDAVVTGSVARAADRVRVTAQLVDPRTEEHLWAERYDRPLRDVLSLQNEIVGSIARRIELALTPAEQTRLASARPVNPEAYEAYLKGKFHLNKFTPEGFEKGLAYLHEAVEKDPANARAHAGLALGYSLVGHEAVPDAFERAKAATARALELDDTLAEVHEAVAETKLYSEWDLPGAEQALQRVLELNPNLPDAHAHYAWYLVIFGRHDEAIAELRRAVELDPLTPLWRAWLAWVHWWAGDYDQAVVEARNCLELNPTFPWGLYVLGGVYAEKGMYEEAIEAHRKAAAASPAVRWGLGHTYAVAGRKEEARRIAAELERNPAPMDCWGLAEIHAALGEKDSAFRWLDAAHEARFSWMPWVAQVPTLKPLRDDPRFHDLARRMNLPEQ